MAGPVLQEPRRCWPVALASGLAGWEQEGALLSTTSPHGLHSHTHSPAGLTHGVDLSVDGSCKGIGVDGKGDRLIGGQAVAPVGLLVKRQHLT